MKKLILIFTLALLSSCNFYSKDILAPENPKINNIQIATNSVSADLQVDILSKRKIKISEIDLNIIDQNDKKIGILRVEDIKINRGTNRLLIPLKLYISSSPIKIISILNDEDIENLRINGSAKVKSGLISKRVKFDNITIEEFVENYLSKIAD
jgi:hypothetical protein